MSENFSFSQQTFLHSTNLKQHKITLMKNLTQMNDIIKSSQIPPKQSHKLLQSPFTNYSNKNTITSNPNRISVHPKKGTRQNPTCSIYISISLLPIHNFL